MNTAPDIIALVRHAEGIRRVELRPAGERILFRPVDGLSDDEQFQLARHKQAVLRYLSERSPMQAAFDRIGNDEIREELQVTFDERVAERMICQGNSREDAEAIAWDELGGIVERRIGELHRTNSTHTTTTDTFDSDSAKRGIDCGGDNRRESA